MYSFIIPTKIAHSFQVCGFPIKFDCQTNPVRFVKTRHRMVDILKDNIHLHCPTYRVKGLQLSKIDTEILQGENKLLLLKSSSSSAIE